MRSGRCLAPNPPTIIPASASAITSAAASADSAAPALLQQHHQPRRQNGAMPHDGRLPGDDQSLRARSDRGMTNLTRSPRPPLSPRLAAPHAAATREAERGYILDRQAQIDRKRHHRNNKPREWSRSLDQSPSRDVSRNRAVRSGDLPPRHGHPRPRGSSRDHEAERPAGSHRRLIQPSDRPYIDRSGRAPLRPHSPRHSKRQRSRSPHPRESQTKRPRWDPGTRSSGGVEPDTGGPPYPGRRPFLRPDRCPTQGEQRWKKNSGRPSAPPASNRGRSPSPPRDRDFGENPKLHRLGPKPPRSRDHSLAFRAGRPRPSSSCGEGPPLPQGGPRSSIPDACSRGRRSPANDLERYHFLPPPPRSPTADRQDSNSSGRQRRRDRSRSRELHAEPASGANSIGVSMSGRGNFRGVYGGQHPSRGYYSQGPHSAGHGTPNCSFHSSPPARSPYGSGRGSWGGQQQFSPQSQYPQFPQNGYAPTAPAAHFHGNQANSPPIGTPKGPSNQFTQSSYRGGYRSSSSGGFRGNKLGSGRVGSRGGFKSGQWGSSGNDSRAASSQPDDASSGHVSPRAGSSVGDQTTVDGDPGAQEADNPFRPPKELQVEDTCKIRKNETQPMLPPTSRPLPTGPASEKKISFALKSSSKAAVATPKFDISSKFNAPAKKEPPKEQGRNDARDDKGNRDCRDHDLVKHDTDNRDLPRNVPTEPRAVKEKQRQCQEQQKHRESPVRMVKKKVKRLRPKLTVPDDLIGSDSVYFRKPGNESVIGAGTYGKVFKALHVYTKKLVALKRIRMESERDGFPVTAVREIKLLQSLRHINIVALLEVMVEKNECYMVFEYMSHDLTGILNHPTFKLEAAHKKHLSKQLFEGLDYLHQRGVLHRDIKAANILVSSDGILKLADFGLARFYAKRHQLDYTNRVITIWYRSPELLLGETQYSPAVDVWSAACVMIEIFTRRAIFPGDGGEISQLDKIYSVLGTPQRSDWPGLVDLPWFELLRPGVRQPNVFAELYEEKLPPAGFKLLAEMLRYDPAQRPTAARVLEHPYFSMESPAPRQVVELQQVDGDWHEFESKALRRENERKEREARKAVEKETVTFSKDVKDTKKRPSEASDTSHRDTKRQLVEKPAPPGSVCQRAETSSSSKV